jgi:hypothetical protein
VGLGYRPHRRRAAHDAVLRLVGLVPVPMVLPVRDCTLLTRRASPGPGVPVRHPRMVALTETVRVAKADLVPPTPTSTPATTPGPTFSRRTSVHVAVSAREHRATRRPADRDGGRGAAAVAPPARTALLGGVRETRKVSWSATVKLRRGGVLGAAQLAGETVWVRVDGDHVVVVQCPLSGPVEVETDSAGTARVK